MTCQRRHLASCLLLIFIHSVPDGVKGHHDGRLKIYRKLAECKKITATGGDGSDGKTGKSEKVKEGERDEKNMKEGEKEGKE